MLLNEITGYNANRKIFEDGTDISEEIDGARAMLPLPAFQIAVVVDVFYNPNLVTPDVLLELEEETSTPELARRMPRNSISARLITRNQDLYDSSPRIFFPVNVFDAEPVKPGEQVFVFFVDQAVNDQVGYWWKRVPQPSEADDLNFTHADRKYQVNDGSTTTEKLAGATPGPPSFINGGEQAEQRTLAGANAYDEINQKARANLTIVKEPVARFNKRPGDKVLQGSNAARIVLGMDRALPGPAPAETTPRPNAAAIDMVVGYGRAGTPTAPIPVANSRGEQEVDKSPLTPDNPIEGDPDMLLDPTRLYLAESTNADANFGSVIPGVPPSPVAPAAVMKSKQVRLLANVPGGDVKISALTNSVVLDALGNISLIGAPRINLGSAAAPQPVVLGTALVLALNAYTAEITAATVALNAAAQNYFAIPVPTPPQQVTFQTAWTAYNTAISLAQANLTLALSTALSTKVFSD